jgi:fused signal recognition particle receptor
MSFFSKLKNALSTSSNKISEGITGIFTKRKLDDETLEELEELLITADMGANVAASLVAALSKQKYNQEISDEEVKGILATEIAAMLAPVATPLVIQAHKPHVIMVVGVNGNGKTTTIGKLASIWKAEGKRVTLAAADTFRAAAAEQLQVWADRNSIELVRGDQGADPASVAHRAYEKAKAEGVDVLVIDTAGRLQNKSDLMQELQKILRVIQKIDANAPHSVIQVLDATTGQNALSQVSIFKEMVGVTGLIVTKLDGTAKGGVVVALAKAHALPIHAIGVGEGIDDLRPFSADEFSQSLVGLIK